MLCTVVLAFVFDGVCARQASQTYETAYGCPESFPGELLNSTYHWCDKTTPLHRKCGADGFLSHGLCEEEQLRDSGAPLLPGSARALLGAGATPQTPWVPAGADLAAGLRVPDAPLLRGCKLEFPPRDLWTTRDAVGDPGETINVCWNASLAARLRDGFDDPLLQAVLHGIFVMIRFAVLAAVSWFMVTVSFYVFVQVCFQRRYRLLRRPGVPATAPRGGRRVLCSGPRQVRAYGRCQAVRVLSAGDLSFHVAGTSSSPIIITHKQVATSVSISWSQAAINVFITSPLAYTVLLGILLPTAVVQPVWFAAMLSVPVWAAARVMLGVAVLLVKTVPTILISAAKTGQRRVVRPLFFAATAWRTA